MKKLILVLAVIFTLAMAAPVLAETLAWDYPTDWDIITGYIVYFTDGVNQYHKVIPRAELTQDGTSVFYEDFESKLNMHFGVEYTVHITAYNDAGESDPSNQVLYTRAGFLPPADQLPDGVVINIPAVPVTININQGQ